MLGRRTVNVHCQVLRLKAMLEAEVGHLNFSPCYGWITVKGITLT